MTTVCAHSAEDGVCFTGYGGGGEICAVTYRVTIFKCCYFLMHFSFQTVSTLVSHK